MTVAGVWDDLNDLAFVEGHEIRMLFLPTAWATAAHSSRTWVEVVFPPGNRGDIPKEPGVYAFVVRSELFDLSGVRISGRASHGDYAAGRCLMA